MIQHLQITPGLPRRAGPCDDCCVWWTPLEPPYRGRALPHDAAMTYSEWLVWHLHVVQHCGQGIVS